MATRNVVLTDHQEELIEGLVSSGRYQNASEVLREGLRLVERREEEDKARLKNLREAARLGIADIEGGRFRDFGSSAECGRTWIHWPARPSGPRPSGEQGRAPMDGAPVGRREADFEHIIQWTSERFGDTQAIVYAETLSMALMALTEGPDIIGAKARDEILKGLFSLHVARQGRKGRHFIMFRLAPRGDVIEVALSLHYVARTQTHGGNSQARVYIDRPISDDGA